MSVAETYSVRCNVIFDLVLDAISHLFDRNGGEVGVNENGIDDGDVLRADLR